MARRVSKPPGADRAKTVEWARWADGDWWELRQGVDFTQTPSMALRALRSWGHRNDCRVSGTVTSAKTISVRITAP